MIQPAPAPEKGPRHEAVDSAPPVEGSRLLRDLATVPNLLSLSRLILIGVCAGLYLGGFPVIGIAVGLLAGITDYLDGWLARKWKQVTELGAILDRLGDLVVELVSFVLTIWFKLFPPIIVILYLFREFVVLSARLYCAEKKWPMPSSFYGKLKTNFFGYSFLVVYLMYSGVIPGETPRLVMEILAWVGVGMGLIFSYVSGISYLKAFVRAYDSR